MYWQEETDREQFVVPEDVIDLLFQINCAALPVDHAWVLAEEINRVLPWFSDEALAGLHVIHVADSGNGWERPQGAEELLYPSRRTPLVLRLPMHRLEDASALSGQTLNIHGHQIEVKTAKSRKLSITDILYSRYVACDPDWEEERFISWAISELKGMRLRFKKILCGKQNLLATPDGPLLTRSLMVANLSYEDAVYLQEQGLGSRRTLGCGVFIPQKSF